MRRPFLGVLIPYAIGIGLGEAFEVPLWLLFAANFALLGGLGLLFALGGRGSVSGEPKVSSTGTTTWLLVGLWVGGGWLNHVRHRVIHAPQDLREVVGEAPVLAEVYGRLATAPELRAVEVKEELRWRSRATIEVEAVRVRGGLLAARGRVWATVREPLDLKFQRGSQVQVAGVLKLPPSAPAPGLFDYRSYLMRRGVYYVLVTDSERDWRLTEGGERIGQRYSERFLRWARGILAMGLPEADEAVRLRWAMLLGWRGVLTEELRSPFLHSGTLHVFAISGLHVSLVASALGAVLRLLRVPRGWRGIVLIPALWAYAGLTGWQPSAVRATVMMSVVIAGWALRRPADLLNSLAGAAVVILLWDPRQMFQAGFQLSFGVVLSLAALVPVFWEWGMRWFEPEPWLPVVLRSRVLEGLRRWARGSVAALGVSLAAWLGSLPFVAWYFNLVTPVSIVINLAIVPLAWVVVLSGLCSLACGEWWVWGTECFNHSGWLAMRLMMEVSAQAARWPGAWWPVARPAWLALVGYYGLLVWPLSVGWKRGWRGGWVIAASSLLAGGLLAPSWLEEDCLEVVVLPVEGGDSLWVDFPGRARDTLIDTANDSGAKWVVGPFLKSRGRRKVPRLVLTHGDVGHVGGVPRLLEDYRMGEVWVSGFKARSSAYRRAVELLVDRAERVRAIGRGWRQGSWKVLQPENGDPFTRADDQALVLLLDWQGARLLLCSDLGRLGQNRLVEREPDLRVDVVVAGVPGVGEEPLQDFLLDVLEPQAIVLSTGRAGGGRGASRQGPLRLMRRAVPVFMTDDGGAVTIRVQPGGIEVEAMDGRRIHIRPRGA